MIQIDRFFVNPICLCLLVWSEGGSCITILLILVGLILRQV
jgi:hypothetical protein